MGGKFKRDMNTGSMGSDGEDPCGGKKGVLGGPP